MHLKDREWKGSLNMYGAVLMEGCLGKARNQSVRLMEMEAYMRLVPGTEKLLIFQA